MPTDPRRILLIRPSALGDVCRTVPALVSLRRRWPGAEIHWLVQDSFAEAIRAHPDLDSVVPFPRGAWRRWWSPRVMWSATSWLLELRARRYDLVFDLQGLGRSGLFALATGAPRRVGFRDARELGWLGVNRRVDRRGILHTVDQMLALLQAEGVPPVADLRLTVAPDGDAAWRERRRSLDLREPYAVLAPTSRWRGKQWPADRWAGLSGQLAAAGLRGRVVVVGAPGEQAQTAWSRGVPQCVDLCGACTVGETMAVIRDAALVVANDSAPLHMAAGMGVPYVGLFGPTDPERVGPYRGRRWVLGGPANEEERRRSYRDVQDDAIMRRIEVEPVVRLVSEALAAREWFEAAAEGRA